MAGTAEPQRPGAPPSEAEAIDRLVEREAITIVFQPIVDLRSGDVLGHEALSRITGPSSFANVGALYDSAARHGHLDALERLARRRTFEAFGEERPDGLLFMNNSPPVLAAEGFLTELLREAAAAAPRQGRPGRQRVVLEITERSDFHDPALLQASLRLLRESGFQIALDDVGAGMSGLNRIMALRPDWVKLDRALVSDVDRDPLRRNLLRSFVLFAHSSGIALVAEGIERREELEVLVELGVRYGQGYYLGRPEARPREIDTTLRHSIVSIHETSDALRFEEPATVRAISLAEPVSTFDSSTPCRDVRAHLAGGSLDCAVILDGRRYIGTADSQSLADAPDAAPVGTSTIHPSALVSQDVTLAEALEIAASHADERCRHPLVVQREGRIEGVVPLRQLLKAAAECHRRAPAPLAALTGLPGRAQADRWVNAGIRARCPHNVAFIDLRDFDAYNVAYGFQLGDAMLLRLVGLTRERLGGSQRQDGFFFAHLGEDRFMVAFRGDPRPALRQLVHDFALTLREFFSAADVDSGCFTCADSSGRRSTHALTSLRILYLEGPLLRVASHRELRDLVRQLRLADRPERQPEDPILCDRRGPALAHSQIA